MKKTRFTEEQMVTIPREANEKSVPEVAKKQGDHPKKMVGARVRRQQVAYAHGQVPRRRPRESLAIDVAGGIRSGRVIEVLAQLVSVHGAPRYLRSDNGPVRRVRDPAVAARGRLALTRKNTNGFLRAPGRQ